MISLPETDARANKNSHAQNQNSIENVFPYSHLTRSLYRYRCLLRLESTGRRSKEIQCRGSQDHLPLIQMISAAVTPSRFVGGTEDLSGGLCGINFLIAVSFSYPSSPHRSRTITSAARKSLSREGLNREGY